MTSESVRFMTLEEFMYGKLVPKAIHLRPEYDPEEGVRGFRISYGTTGDLATLRLHEDAEGDATLLEVMFYAGCDERFKKDVLGALTQYMSYYSKATGRKLEVKSSVTPLTLAGYAKKVHFGLWFRLNMSIGIPSQKDRMAWEEPLTTEVRGASKSNKDYTMMKTLITSYEAYCQDLTGRKPNISLVWVPTE